MTSSLLDQIQIRAWSQHRNYAGSFTTPTPLTSGSTQLRQPARHNRPPGMIGVMPDPV
jgi:hypothetical protein